MKSVFVLRGSSDGIIGNAYTNVKVMFDYIQSESGYNPIKIEHPTLDKNMKFNYSNLLSICNERESNYLTCTILCNNDAEIRIHKLNIVSK